MGVKSKFFNQCVLPIVTYGCQIWSLTNALVKKPETSQQTTERKMINVKLKDRIGKTIIRQRTRVTDIVEYVFTNLVILPLAEHRPSTTDTR